MNTQFSTRIAAISDAAGIARVQTLSWQSTYAGIIDDNFLDSLDAEKKQGWWAKAIPQGMTVHVAETGGEIVGFATGGKSRNSINEIEGELFAIYILKKYQCFGIGKALFLAVVQQLLSQNISSLFVWVLKDNTSKNFYIKLGGELIAAETVKIGEQNLTEEAYGWSDISFITF